MKVKDLIAELQRQNPEAEAVVADSETLSFVKVDTVRVAAGVPSRISPTYYHVPFNTEITSVKVEAVVVIGQ
jgi:hypothetical protein